MTAQPKVYVTVPEYLELERTGDIKHEYFAGAIYAMVGASVQHNLITGNTYASLHAQLRKRNCNVFPSDMRVKAVQTGLYTYPDITVVCGQLQFEDEREDTLVNPVVLIEVLSPSTENYDRGKKFQNYRTMLSLREYILIAQDDHRVEHYARQSDNTWILSEVVDLHDRVELTSIQCVLDLVDIYEKVEIAATDEDDVSH